MYSLKTNIYLHNKICGGINAFPPHLTKKKTKKTKILSVDFKKRELFQPDKKYKYISCTRRIRRIFMHVSRRAVPEGVMDLPVIIWCPFI